MEFEGVVLRSTNRLIIAIILVMLVVSCAKQPKRPEGLLSPTEAQMKTRELQTRTFDVANRARAMRGVIAALQDLGFIIERANEPLGIITAAKFAEPDWYSVVGITVAVRSKGSGVFTIRANVIFNNEPVTDAETYQNFFATLERSMFIGRN